MFNLCLTSVERSLNDCLTFVEQILLSDINGG